MLGTADGLDTTSACTAKGWVWVEGEMWLSAAGHTRHLCAGDRFELDRDVPHAERYGAAGAAYRVARRS